MPVSDANLIVYLRTPDAQGRVEVVAVEVPGQGVIHAPTSNLRTAPAQIGYVASFNVIKSAEFWCIHIPFDCDVWCLGATGAQQPAARGRTAARTRKTKTASVRKRSRR